MGIFRKILCLILAALLLAGCGRKPAATAQPTTEATEETVPETTAAPEYQPVMNADGKSMSLGCKNKYTDGGMPTDAVVATFGSAELTGKQLQVLYSMAVFRCMDPEGDGFLDPSIPLYAQFSEGTATTMSEEQYFLSRAMHTWQVITALIQASRGTQIAEDPGFQPSAEQHATYLPEGLPVLEDIYGNKESYEMPAMHRQWIDSLPDTLNQLAQRYGCGSAAELAQQMGADEEALMSVCTQLNEAYSYYVNLWEMSQPKQGETAADDVEQFRRLLDDPGSVLTVDLRQMLLIPENAEICADGTVNASEESWQAAMSRAQEHYDSWRNAFATIRHSEATFAAMANELSEDSSTAVDGGNLNGITRGQLIPVLDGWCFDPQRSVGDSAILRSDYGVILVCLTGMHTEQGRKQAADEVSRRMQERLAPILSADTLMADYSAVSLAEVRPCPAYLDVLYPDVGHEQIDRFPAFFQQDYPYIAYGKYTMPIGGCGVTSLAMLATYMSDTLMTPTELAGIYGNEYATVVGTNGDMYTQIPPELGFYVDNTCFDWPTVGEAMAQGKSAISLQMNGPFTKGGHYLLLSTMKDDGTVVVRDPSITHYVKLEGFKNGSFDGSVVNRASGMYWIFQNKILTIPGCSRCGDGKCYAVQGDYICRKCTRALARQGDFCLDALG